MSAAAIITRVQESGGGDLSVFDATFLEKSVARRMAATGAATPGEYLARMDERPGEIEVLVDSLRVGHSEFFRDPLAFALLEHLILPDLDRERVRAGRSELRIWSTGCAGGQEAYSIAIVLDADGRDLETTFPARIFATDVSEAALARARQGVYSAVELCRVPLGHVETCFERRGRNYALVPRLKERVDFSRHDLLDPGVASPPASVYGEFDLVWCCNVLLYYRPEVRRAIIGRIRGCLVAGGCLVVGEAEKAAVAAEGGWRAVFSPAPVFRKTGKGR
jgi:chemotaxis methyl-accepting protein methylase